MKTFNAGAIELSDDIIISDPYYNYEYNSCENVNIARYSIMPGLYVVTIEKEDNMNENTALNLRHVRYLNIPLEAEDALKLPVDTGLMSVWNSEEYFMLTGTDRINYVFENWGKTPYANESYFSYFNFAACVSGFGDGIYPLYVFRNEDNIPVGFRITF